MRKKKRQRYLVRVVPGDGDPCPRCGVPMQIREYNNLTDKHLHRPYFYTRWFCCTNKSCRTTLVMPERYKVRANASAAKLITSRKFALNE
jgi:hypothetical protein